MLYILGSWPHTSLATGEVGVGKKDMVANGVVSSTSVD